MNSSETNSMIPGLVLPPLSPAASGVWSGRQLGPKLGAELAGEQAGFATILAKSRGGAGKTGKKPEEEAREAAADFVAAALVEPVLKELRSSNQSAAPFAPGPAEKQFGGMLDAQFARRITRGAQFPLVERVAQLLLKNTGGDAASAPSDAPKSAGGAT